MCVYATYVCRHIPAREDISGCGKQKWLTLMHALLILIYLRMGTYHIHAIKCATCIHAALHRTIADVL